MEHKAAADAIDKVILSATTVTVSAELQAATPIKVGDVLLINYGGLNDNDAFAAEEVVSFLVQVSTVSGAADPVCTFATAINAAALPTILAAADGVTIDIVGRTQAPVCRTSSMTNNINMYSFALEPEEHQPSGTCNFSRIDTATLELSAAKQVEAIYALNYNVLRIMSGMGGLAYSN